MRWPPGLRGREPPGDQPVDEPLVRLAERGRERGRRAGVDLLVASKLRAVPGEHRARLDEPLLARGNEDRARARGERQHARSKAHLLARKLVETRETVVKRLGVPAGRRDDDRDDGVEVGLHHRVEGVDERERRVPVERAVEAHDRVVVRVCEVDVGHVLSSFSLRGRRLAPRPAPDPGAPFALESPVLREAVVRDHRRRDVGRIRPPALERAHLAGVGIPPAGRHARKPL